MSDTWKGSENARTSKFSYYPRWAFPNQDVATPILCHKLSLNVVTIEAKLALTQLYQY